MWNGWQHTHSLWFFPLQHTKSWGCFGGFAILTKSGPTAWVHWGLDEQDPGVIMSHACQTLPIHPQNMWNMWQHIHGICSACNIIYQPEDGMVDLQFLPNLVPQLCYSVAWMDCISVYWLWFSVIRPCPCTHKTWGMGDNIFMACGSSLYSTLNPEDVLVVLQFPPSIWSHSLGALRLGWTGS